MKALILTLWIFVPFFLILSSVSMFKLFKRKKTADEPEPLVMPKNASSKPEMKLPKHGWDRRPQNWYCQEGLLGHPVLWTPDEAIAAITTMLPCSTSISWRQNNSCNSGLCKLQSGKHCPEPAIDKIMLQKTQIQNRLKCLNPKTS